jgi:hypothetical protein
LELFQIFFLQENGFSGLDGSRSAQQIEARRSRISKPNLKVSKRTQLSIETEFRSIETEFRSIETEFRSIETEFRSIETNSTKYRNRISKYRNVKKSQNRPPDSPLKLPFPSIFTAKLIIVFVPSLMSFLRQT